MPKCSVVTIVCYWKRGLFEKILEWERWSDYIGFWRWVVPGYHNHRAVCPLVWKEDTSPRLNERLQNNDKKLHKISLDFLPNLWYNPLAIKQRPRRPGCVYLFNSTCQFWFDWNSLLTNQCGCDIIQAYRMNSGSDSKPIRKGVPHPPCCHRWTAEAIASYGTTTPW